MKFQPLFDRLLVKPADERTQTLGGLAIPDVARSSRPYAFGTVLAVGAGRTNAEGLTIPCIVKDGDTIAYPRRAGTTVDIEGPDGKDVTVIMMQERDVFAIVTDMPVVSAIAGLDGRLLSMMPSSRAMPDSAYKNREEQDLAERAGFDDINGETTDEPNDHT
jgi:chaperonin GroES